MELKGKYGTAIVFTEEVESGAISQVITLLNQPMSKDSKTRIMPDIHAGSGCVIGYTAKLTDKTVPNLIGVDIGCFTGDTKVALADGRELSFIELIEEDKIGKINYCFSIDTDQNVVLSKIKKPRETRSTNTLIRITLDNGELINCTLDHVFYTRSGQEIEAKDLKIGQSLMPLEITKSERIQRKDLSDKNKSGKRGSYKVVFNPNTEKYDYIHILADNYNLGVGVYVLEDGKNIRHHVNFNKYNNNPDNIKRLTSKEHWEEHKKVASKNNKLGLSGWKRSWELHREEFSKMSSEKMSKLHKDPEFAQRLKERAYDNIKEYIESDKKKEDDKLAGKRGAKYLTEYNKTNNSTVYVCEKCDRKIKGKGGYRRHFLHCKNHKVASVEVVEKQSVPVYCLTIEDHHNFALASGVFVHNCGVIAWNLGKVAPKFDKLDKFIKINIPAGKHIHGDRVDVRLVAEVFRTIKTHFSLEEFESNMKEICERTGQSYDYVWNSLGSLGGGNHFLELDKDDNNDIWFIVHSGSRNFGLKIANYHQNVAKRAAKKSYTDEQIKSIVQKHKNTPNRGKLIQEEINRLKAAKPKIPTGLEYLEKETAANYFHDMQIAQLYAQLNRRLMGLAVVAKFYKLKYKDVEVIESVHNYINFEDKIVRKGAISAHEGEKVIIPLTMADGCLIGVGLGNEDWNFSAPHGLGRIRSRTNAKANIRLEDYQRKMRKAGVWSSCISKKTLDEAPQAYKKPEHIIKYLKDTVNIEVQMKPIYNFKSSE